MMFLMALLPLFQVEKKADLEGTKLFVYDSERGITLRVKDDGKVELAVKDPKGDKTYAADSREEFARRYPEVVRKHGLQPYFRTPSGIPGGDFERMWDELRGRRLIPELPELGPFDGDLEKFLEEQRRRYDDMRKEFQRRFSDPNAPAPAPGLPPAAPAPGLPPPAPGGREFGIKIDSVGETLRDQLSLREGEGVLVGEVKPQSLAERSGVKQHDIILKLDGHAVGDKWEFRKDVLKALEKNDFAVDVLRGGKNLTLKVTPGAKKED
ncbi:MAG TPA: PDZ domain-containing protein [Planctomycetota bacterium]|nr:PDZ domain-containing protein [Planctomycetota bacterium]